MLFIGSFEAIESQRGIAWRCQDRLLLRTFLKFSLHEATPDHSSLSKIGDRLPRDVYEEVFAFVLKRVDAHGLLKGKTVGVDSTCWKPTRRGTATGSRSGTATSERSRPEAHGRRASNRPCRIVRKETGEDWRADLQRLAAAAGLDLKTRDEWARFDKQRKKDGQKQASNEEWESKTDGDARIMTMKDGSTHLARCSFRKTGAENAIDLETGAILAAEIPRGNLADSATVVDTLDVAIAAVIDTTGEDRVPEAVADQGYCKRETLADCAERDLATSFSEPKVNGERRWHDKPEEWKSAFDANHEQITSDRGKELLRQRGEVVERTFAHLCETGGRRRVTVRGTSKVTAWYQLRAAAHNLSRILRKLLGTGKPRAFSGAWKAVWAFLATLQTLTKTFLRWQTVPITNCVPVMPLNWRLDAKLSPQPFTSKHTAFSTGG